MLFATTSSWSATLRRAYQDLVLVWHPDRLPESRRLRAAAKLKEVSHA